jgi:predicted TIM-barrel fold metal-dependent hydrolase
VAELGVGWLPYVIEDIDGKTDPTTELFLGEWKLPLKPSDYIRRNVRATPLDATSDRPLDLLMQRMPADMMLFSSDFPHFEGHVSPKDWYDAFFAQHADKLPAGYREDFMGNNLAALFERMGQPLEVPGSLRETA